MRGSQGWLYDHRPICRPRLHHRPWQQSSFLRFRPRAANGGNEPHLWAFTWTWKGYIMLVLSGNETIQTLRWCEAEVSEMYMGVVSSLRLSKRITIQSREQSSFSINQQIAYLPEYTSIELEYWVSFLVDSILPHNKHVWIFISLSFSTSKKNKPMYTHKLSYFTKYNVRWTKYVLASA